MDSPPRFSAPERLLFGLMAAAALQLSHAWCEASALTWGHGLAGGALWCSVGWLLLRRLGRRTLSLTALTSTGLVLFFAHTLFDLALRRVWGLGSGAEYLLLAGLVNVGFFFLGQDEPRLRRLTLPLSLAVAVFGLSLSQGWLGSAYAALYLGLVVLVLLRLSGITEGERLSRLAVGAPVMLVFLLGCWLTGGQTLTPLGGHLHGSGGGAESDPFGRGGVGNGDGEVAATQKTEDIGFANTDVTVESDKRTLYDAVNEFYGEPEPPKKLAPKHRKATFLAKEILEKPKGPLVAPSATKGFSTRRAQGKPAAQTKNQAAQALLYVTGRAPLHLRLTAYERYTDHVWHEGKTYLEKEVVQPVGGDWMSLATDLVPGIFGAQEYHEVKLGTLVTDRLPIPPYPRQVRIDRLSQPDFYQWAQRGILRLNDIPQIPPGVKIEVRSQALDYTRLRVRQLQAQPPLPGKSTYYQLPDRLDPRIAALARQWVEGIPEGWPQVEAVIAHLRRHALHDPQARPPAQSAEPLSWFLFESRRGPDYLFSGAAAILLRTLGYPTRVVTGLYVSGKQRDPRSGHHLLFSKDLHFWVEVESEAKPNEERIWVVLEPTPGYTTASPLPTLADQLRFALEGARLTLKRHALVLGALVGLLGLAWWGRRGLGDSLWTFYWHALVRLAPHRAVLAALHLLERRARWAGVPRPAGTSLRRHYGAHAARAQPEAQATLLAFLQQVEHALYDTSRSIPSSPHVLARALHDWTRRRLKETAS